MRPDGAVGAMDSFSKAAGTWSMHSTFSVRGRVSSQCLVVNTGGAIQ